MWDLLRPEIEPISLALAGGFYHWAIREGPITVHVAKLMAGVFPISSEYTNAVSFTS